MNYIREYQYKNLAATDDARIYNGTLYVVPTDDTKNIVTSPVNKLTGTNATTTTDTTVISNTLSGEGSDSLKFNVSFKVHSTVWTEAGNKRLFDLPGIAQMFVNNGSLFLRNYTDGIAINYLVPSESLVTGWNTFAIYGDGTYIKFDANTTTYMLRDCSNYVSYMAKTYSGFSASKYLYLPSGVFTPANWNKWKMQYHLIAPNGTYDMRVCGTVNNGAQSQLVLGTHSSYRRPTFWLCANGQASGWTWAYDNGFTQTGSDTTYNYNAHWWYGIEFTGSKYIVYTSVNGTTFTQFSYRDETTKLTNRDTPYRMGSCENSGYWRGSLILDGDTFIEADGQRVFGGEMATLDTNYYINGTLTSTEAPAEYGTKYPTISVGDLETYQTALYLKDIQAIKLED